MSTVTIRIATPKLPKQGTKPLFAVMDWLYQSQPQRAACGPRRKSDRKIKGEDNSTSELGQPGFSQSELLHIFSLTCAIFCVDCVEINRQWARAMPGLKEYLNIDVIADNLTVERTAEFCAGALDASTLFEELDFGPFSSRKTFCEYLGIGESTLTGWLKGERVPRMAKEAYVLLLAVQGLRAEVRTPAA